jgi:hypothetical protein
MALRNPAICSDSWRPKQETSIWRPIMAGSGYPRGYTRKSGRARKLSFYKDFSKLGGGRDEIRTLGTESRLDFYNFSGLGRWRPVALREYFETDLFGSSTSACTSSAEVCEGCRSRRGLYGRCPAVSSSSFGPAQPPAVLNSLSRSAMSSQAASRFTSSRLSRMCRIGLADVRMKSR